MPSPVRNVRVAAGAGAAHEYYNRLLARPDLWKSSSFRDAAIVANKAFMSYDPLHDTDPERQDATKCIIPPFNTTTALAQPMAKTDLTFVPADKRSTLWPTGRTIKIVDEIITTAGSIRDPTTNAILAVKATRAQHGTAAADHPQGGVIKHSTNTLPSKVYIPLGTEDGNRYFAVWDTYWTQSFHGAGYFNHKAFNFMSGGSDALGAIWFEPQCTYNRPAAEDITALTVEEMDAYNAMLAAGYLGSHQVRSYNQLGGPADWTQSTGNQCGPGVTGNEPLKPCVPFPVNASRWVRFMVEFDQRAQDYDRVNMWVGDQDRQPIQTLANILVSVRKYRNTGPDQIVSWLPEFNSSNDALMRTDQRNLVVYIRNFAVLRNPATLPIESPI